MTNEEDKWLSIKVKPAVDGAIISRLDDHLTQILPAGVTQHLEAGEWSYKPDEEGTYEVRLHLPELRAFAENIIIHNAFKVVHIIEQPDGIELPLTPKA